MFSLRSFQRKVDGFRLQVDSLRRRIEPILAILRLRNLAMEFCDEFEEIALNEGYPHDRLTDMCIMFPPRVGQAGFRLYTFMDLNKYLRGRVNIGVFPAPREMVFTLIPWAGKGPILRPNLWERPSSAA